MASGRLQQKFHLQTSNMKGICEMTNDIKSFSLNDCSKGNQGYYRVLLQLFGFLGHGKSSFINTCKYVLEDQEYNMYADVSNTFGGNTTARITYTLTKTLMLVDNRGCSKLDDYETGEIFAQLANLLPVDKEVEWSRGFELTERIIKAEKLVKSSDFIFPIFVFSVKKGLQPQEVPGIQQLLEFARDVTEIFPVVVLTHKTHGDVNDMERAFKNMGVEWLISLENFTPEDHIRTKGRHEGVLKFFCEVIKDVQFRLERMGDPDEQREQRKLKVLRFISDREVRNKLKEVAIEMRKKEQEIELRREEELRKRLMQIISSSPPRSSSLSCIVL
ncbi:uncharacterized protein LOC121397023 [Xenopus laevis]|uniref:Uncharacterized protein LOC121397023 n=2 Tax=Xenopus laevis TaxID=8355 RepID=A0A1L8F7A6_XENLA|nr:uncharacterized protein LOC121397023 [Xenopus laevis]OCT67470.1 hypothetical protein XELAEV_18038767mg [Xenopus laevis]